MKFAVCAKFSGMMNDRMEYCPSDMTLGDVVNLLERLEIEHDITDEGESDYRYLGCENGETDTDRILMRCRISDGGADVSKFNFWLRWGAFVRDVSVNAILDRKTFSALVEPGRKMFKRSERLAVRSADTLRISVSAWNRRF